MTDTTTDLSEFNIQATLGFFKFLPQTDLEIKAIRYVHKCTNLEMGSSGDSRISKESIVNDVAIEKIHYRYELYKLHVGYFFPKNYEVDHDALSLAVICDEYTSDINEPLQPPEPPEGWCNDNDNFLRRDDGVFDTDLIDNAQALWEQAAELEGVRLSDDEPRPDPEVYFLAHINALQSLRKILPNLKSYGNDGLADILQSDLRAARDFAWGHTEIGNDLLELIDQVENAILPLMIIEPEKSSSHELHIVTP